MYMGPEPTPISPLKDTWYIANIIILAAVANSEVIGKKPESKCWLALESL
jgi:hypothetical protein